MILLKTLPTGTLPCPAKVAVVVGLRVASLMSAPPSELSATSEPVSPLFAMSAPPSRPSRTSELRTEPAARSCAKSPPNPSVSSRTSVVISLSMMSELRIVSAAYAVVPPSATNSASHATAFCRIYLEPAEHRNLLSVGPTLPPDVQGFASGEHPELF